MAVVVVAVDWAVVGLEGGLEAGSAGLEAAGLGVAGLEVEDWGEADLAAEAEAEVGWAGVVMVGGAMGLEAAGSAEAGKAEEEMAAAGSDIVFPKRSSKLRLCIRHRDSTSRRRRRARSDQCW